ncbi:hypothetical protein PGC35_02440 [Psychrobacillus sp. PGGUH221]|uniref:hypothetical protein n=1 Tax=Psychrobacillus sp. PGGUH221 TaxID=3020058 RepID=UPI0035C6EE16
MLANGKISADDYITLPQVKIENSVSKVDLCGTIQNVYVKSKNDVVITGFSNIDNLEIDSNKRITLNTNGAIKNLTLNNTESTVFIGNDTVIGNFEPPNGKTAKEVVVNYYQAEDKIEKISGVFNEKFNLELKDKLNTDNFKARAWFVAGRFGYVKIDMKNQGNNIVKYTLEEKGDRVTPLHAKGEQVPVEAIEYHKGDEFIVWHDHEVVIYLVDENGVILDLVESYELEWRSLEKVEIKQNDWVSIRTNTKIKDNSVSEIISHFYFYQDGIVHKIKDFKNYSWTFEDGIPTLNLYLEEIKANKPSLYSLFYARGEGPTGYLNKGYNDEDLNIFVLYEMLDGIEDGIGQFGSFLSNIYRFKNKHPDTEPTNGVQFDSLSMDAYKQELRKNKTNLQTADAIKVMVDVVNAKIRSIHYCKKCSVSTF